MRELRIRSRQYRFEITSHIHIYVINISLTPNKLSCFKDKLYEIYDKNPLQYPWNTPSTKIYFQYLSSWISIVIFILVPLGKLFRIFLCYFFVSESFTYTLQKNKNTSYMSMNNKKEMFVKYVCPPKLRCQCDLDL